jgi:transcription elongation GreA/GreB family factor
MSTATKEQLLKACEVYVESKLHTVQNAIKDLEAALKLETKCSMGDKYETGRAMLHLEFEKLAGQHQEFSKLRKTLRMIPGSRKDTAAGFGSVVKTSLANYFIAIPAGELTVAGEKYYAVGAGSPIAKALTGKTEGDSVTFNGREFQIQKVI